MTVNYLIFLGLIENGNIDTYTKLNIHRLLIEYNLKWPECLNSIVQKSDHLSHCVTTLIMYLHIDSKKGEKMKRKMIVEKRQDPVNSWLGSILFTIPVMAIDG